MAISFDSIPNNLRNHGTYIEFNAELAGATSQDFQVVMVGQRLAAGNKAAGTVVQVTDPDQAKAYFGQGSLLANMCGAFLNANAETPLFCIALDDDGAAVAAAGTITVDTAATKAGTLYVYIGGERVSVGIAADDTVDDIAANIAAEINANSDYPVTAAVNGTTSSQVDVTARNAGEAMNGLNMRANYYGEKMPDGLTLTFVDLANGSGNPDLADAIDAMGDTWFNWIINPYTDTANLTTLTDHLNDVWGPLVQQDRRAFSAFSGTLAECSTFGNALNSPHLTVMGTNKSPTPVYMVAAINGAIGSYYLAIDPARPLQTLELKGMLAPAAETLWTRSERNVLLYDGIATFKVMMDGTCQIERQITTYQRNNNGLTDAAYLDINTPETLSRIRYEQRSMIAARYPRHKLADDGTEYGAGQAIVTPSLIKAALLGLYRELEDRGWVEDFDTYKANLIVERNASDRTRIDWRDTPNLVNQARVFAGKSQFIL